jgi:apolipoprotein D and lipocalin family protein
MAGMQGAAAGRWYEIGKIQTAGGAFFEKTCVCTNLVWTAAENGADGSVSNICRNKVPTGKLEVFNASLKADPQKPGCVFLFCF